MKYLTPVINLLNIVWRFLRTKPHVTSVAMIIALLGLLVARHFEYHLPYMPEELSGADPLPKGWEPLPDLAYIGRYLLAYVRLFVLFGGIVFHIAILRAYPDADKMLKPTWIASIYLSLWAMADSLYSQWESGRVASIGEEFSIFAYVLQMLLTIGMILSPPLVLTYFTRCRIMEKYVLKNFLQPLIFCFISFCSLWIVMDLLDNLSNFRENNIPMGTILLFYAKLIPFIYVSVAPVTVLLSALYSLGRMSRSNEIISMLGAGKSMGQVLRPVFIVGAYASFLGMAANYHWAPVAEGNKKSLLEDVKEKMNKNIMSLGLVYRNQEQHRSWFVGIVPYDLRNDKMRRIEVRQDDENGKLQKAWYAKSIAWWPDRKVWTLYQGVEATFEDGDIISVKDFDEGRSEHEGWNETPWVLISGSLTPEFLGVPELLSYLKANQSYGRVKLAPFLSHFYYRFALPWHCMVVVLVAAPLGVVFSRRGMLGGVASSVFIFFILIFIDSFFLNLGKGGHLAPWLTVWMPHLILGIIGSVLFYFRSQGRDFPKLNSWTSIVDSAKFLWDGILSIFARHRA
jgi:LPS export ABC transporter permease LptG